MPKQSESPRFCGLLSTQNLANHRLLSSQNAGWSHQKTEDQYYSKGTKTPALIAQEDWPDCNFSSYAVAFPTLNLYNLNIPINLNGYNNGGQTKPVFPGIVYFIVYFT